MTDAPMRVVMVDSHAAIERGGAIQCARLAASLAERGHRVTCIFDVAGSEDAQGGAEWTRMESAGVRIERRALGSPATILRFREELTEWAPDIVHTHKNRALYFLAGATRGRGDFGWVANRGTEYSLWREPPAWAIHRYWVDRMIPVADAVRAQLIRDGIPAERAITVYGSFDDMRFDPSRALQDMRAAWGVPAAVSLIGMAASFNSRKKGQSDFLRAAARVCAERQDVHFVLAGDGPSDRYRFEAEELGIGRHVHFPGFVADMPAALASFDAVVCASVRGEGLTGSVREALAMARPVISTDVAGNRELVRDGQTGLLVPVKTYSAMATAMLRMIADQAAAAAMGQAGRKLVLELCTDAVRAAKVEQVYRALIAERRAR